MDLDRFRVSPSVIGRTIRETWPICLRTIVGEGRLVGPVVDQRGDLTYEVVGLRVEITNPLKDMIPTLPKTPGVTAWCRQDVLDDYYESEIIGTKPAPAGFSYVYADWIKDPVLKWIIISLRENPDTRRAIITFGANNDMFADDPPCLRSIQFIVRGGKLNMITTWRSRDFAGAAATNMYGMIRLQEHVASEVGIPVGRYIDFSGSAHIRIGKICNKNDRGDLDWVEKVI